MSRKKFNKEYEVKSGSVPKLSIKFGDAQLGASAVSLDDELLAVGDVADLPLVSASLGTSEVIFRIKSVVTDVNDMTDRISITYSLVGGLEPRSFQFKDTVSRQGDSIIYNGEIKIVEIL